MLTFLQYTFMCTYLYIYLETLLFLYHRSSCLRFGSCRSPDFKGMSLCCSWDHGGLYLLDSCYVRSCDGHAGTHSFPLLASFESRSHFRLLFPWLKTGSAAFSVVNKWIPDGFSRFGSVSVWSESRNGAQMSGCSLPVPVWPRVQAAAQVMCNSFQYHLHSRGCVCVLQSSALKYFLIGYFVLVAPTGTLQPSVILQPDFGSVPVLFSLLTATLSPFL